MTILTIIGILLFLSAIITTIFGKKNYFQIFAEIKNYTISLTSYSIFNGMMEILCVKVDNQGFYLGICNFVLTFYKYEK